MNQTKVLTFSLAFSVSLAFAHNEEQYSFYSLIKNKVKGNYTSKFNARCLRKLRNFFKEGKELYIPELDSMKETIESYPFKSKRSKSVFYHYTRSSIAKRNALGNNSISFFKYNRVTRKDDGFSNVFIAKDPYSSSGYGEIQLRFKISLSAVVVNVTSDDLMYEVLNTYPKLSSCWGDTEVSEQENPFFSLILEENGVDIWAYHSDDWFQIVNHRVIEELSVGEFEEWY